MTEETLFELALRTPEAERAALLDRACEGKPELRARVEALLAGDAGSSPLSKPSPTIDATTGFQATASYTSAEPSPGILIAGRYTLEQKLGEGGMGEVWVAKQSEPVKRKVALKLIKAGMDSKSVVQRFEQERQALAMMDHPNIAKVLDGGITIDRRPFFVMELVNGLPLTKFCDETKLAIKERLELFVPICQAVQHAHQKGIVHRDLKPGNILVTIVDGKPVPKVIDFGVAKATSGRLTDESMSTQFGAVIGTLEYMSPEQAGFSNQDVDTRADIYSLGVILYELLTGLRPFDSKRLKLAALDEVIRIIREEEPSKPSTKLSTDEALPSLAAVRHIEPGKLTALLRGELDWVVMKCLEKQRDRRYETANGLARDIQRYLANETVEARPPSTGYRLWKLFVRNKGKVIAASIILFTLLAGIAGTTWGLIETKKAMEEAQHAKRDADQKRQDAETNLGYARKANEILGSVFQNLNPNKKYETPAELRDALKANLSKSVQELEGTAIGDTLIVAEMQDTLGQSLFGLGAAEQAIPLFIKAREARTAKLGPNHPITLSSMAHLAASYHDAGKRDLALALLEETLKLQMTVLGPQHVDTLSCMANLAQAYKYSGKLSQAIPRFEETLKLQKTTLGDQHPDTLRSMANLAQAFQEADKPDLAISLFEETFKLQKATIGHSDPDTLTSMNNLAWAYKAAGKLDLALPLFEENLKLTTARQGPEHLHTLITMTNLAGTYRDAGKLDQALSLFEVTLKLKKAKLGVNHPDTLMCMNNYAAALWQSKQLDKSIPMYKETLRLTEAKFGRNHFQTLLCKANLGVNFKDAGRLKEAIPLLEQAQRAVKKYPMLSWVEAQLLETYAKANMSAEVAKLIDELLADARKQLPKDSPQLASQLTVYGQALLEIKRNAEAEPLLREALAIREKTQPDVWTTFNTQSILGGALLGQKKYDDAEPLLLKGYEGLKARKKTNPSQGNIRLPKALDRLIQLYTETNKPDEVKKWQAEKDKLDKAKSK